MLAFAKDISEPPPTHPEEVKNPKLKEYMDYHRNINHEKLVYYSLDQSKGYLQKEMGACSDDKKKIEDYLKNNFPITYSHVKDPEQLLMMLRKLINAHNSTNNWYRMNPYFCTVVYDCMNQFVTLFNRLLNEGSDEVNSYQIFRDQPEKINFDDWVQLYFHDGDFLIGKNVEHPHFLFFKRNQAIEENMSARKESDEKPETALEALRKEFEMDPIIIRMLLGQSPSPKDLELFYTSRENPIYEYLYDTESPDGFMDGEALIDHSYFLSFQIFGLSRQEASSVLEEAANISRN